MFLNQELFEHCYVRVFSYIFVTLCLFLPARVFLPPETDFHLCVSVCVWFLMNDSTDNILLCVCARARALWW